MLIGCTPTSAVYELDALRPTKTPRVEVGQSAADSTLLELGRVQQNISLSVDSTYYANYLVGDTALPRAYRTLQDFADPSGAYANAWWLNDDGQADMVELVAVILYTEGYPSQYVRQVVGARFLWYCGGAGYACEGKRLINFLAYFQPWIAPETIPYGLDDPNATIYLNMARDIVNQTGQLEAWMPGASQYVHNPNALEEGGSVDWLDAPFHFANVHDSWVPYLEWALNRKNDADTNLWVFTMREAYIVCDGPFICPNMTQPRE